MKKNNIDVKRFSIFIAIVVIVVICIMALISKDVKKQESKLDFSIDNSEAITRIMIAGKNSKMEISSNDIVSKIITKIVDMNKLSITKAKDELPAVTEYYILSFSGSSDVFYLYQNNGKYYIEEKLVAAYEISAEDYNELIKDLYID